ncbi:hypothetical protein BDF14DRAFT_1799064 [Spinellus fusiger]|nr:hypothetical protein BDF14DRAFT_1799064 [Spinellus fusiger]
MLLSSHELYPHVIAAFEYANTHLPHCLIIEHLTEANSNTGLKRLYQDRFQVTFDRIDFGQVTAQIIFDASDYLFPPDITFTSDSPDTFSVDLKKLLPASTWDITQKNCLHDWLVVLWNHMYASTSSTSSENTEIAHSSGSSPLLDVDHKSEDTKSPWTRHRSREKSMIVLDKADRFQLRKSFIKAWFEELPDHVMQCDASNYFYITLYITVSIPHKLRVQMREYQNRSYMKYMGQKVAKAHNSASVIVQINLPPDFPLSTLNIVLVSTVNNESTEACEPDRHDFEYTIFHEHTMSQMMKDVRKVLVKVIPYFHTQLHKPMIPCSPYLLYHQQ